MKTPEEIKKGMECCYSDDVTKRECAKCPYEYCEECEEVLGRDALALIQQLERDKNWESENYDLISEENKRLEAENARLKRERDAAVRDCARFPCYTCKERENGDFCPQCRTTGTFRTLHEWRGPCEENGGQKEEEK